MTIVLCTTNRWKIAEYRRFLARHAQALVVEPPSESPAAIATWLGSARAVLADESNLFDPAGDLVTPDYVGPARNICRLHAWLKDPAGRIVRRTFIREVAGTFDARLLRPGDPAVFDWDAAFAGAAGTLEAMAHAGLKNSAREQCLSAFARAHLHHKEPRRLQWPFAVGDAGAAADWTVEPDLLLDHPLYQALPPALAGALAHVAARGVIFRAAKSRRDGNYWFPGLNGGLPYVPKDDAIHEATYLFHDAMHQLMPDLVFDGADSLAAKRTYIAYRMMSEGVSLVLADMVYADSLVAAHPTYDWSKRKILPLYAELPRGDLRWLLRELVGFVVRGVRGAVPATPAWDAFAAKYTRFFVADFQWTRLNWQSLVARTPMARAWIDLVGRAAFAAQGVWFVDEVVDRLGARGLALEPLCDRLFELVWTERIAPALAHPPGVDRAAARSAGFRRWLTGQVALFARYAPVVALPPLAHELAARIRDPRAFAPAEIAELRARFAAHVRGMAAAGIISDDDAAIFGDLFPLFDPVFLRDYDRAQQEFATVAEASAVAFA